MPAISPKILPILMLLASNVFMSFAWYGHLKFKESLLPSVIMVSWGIAFFEYWLAVPANRWGSAVYSAAQLKTMQEVITLVVFAGFSVLYLKEPLGWNHALGFAFIAAARSSSSTNGDRARARRVSRVHDRSLRRKRRDSCRRFTAFAARAGDDQQRCRQQDRCRQREGHKSDRRLDHIEIAMWFIARCCLRSAIR
jgi:uncharacterized protein (DUF486 family)